MSLKTRILLPILLIMTVVMSLIAVNVYYVTEYLSNQMDLEIKKTIAERVGADLRSSIGIAPNRFLAKTASDMQKPDGLVVIEEEELPHRLHPLALRDLCGIGERMEIRLRRNGIYTVEALCAARKEGLPEERRLMFS